MNSEKIHLFEYIKKPGSISMLTRNMRFKNTTMHKGEISKKAFKRNYHNLYTILRRARTEERQLGEETLARIASALTKIKGRPILVDDIILQ